MCNILEVVVSPAYQLTSTVFPNRCFQGKQQTKEGGEDAGVREGRQRSRIDPFSQAAQRAHKSNRLGHGEEDLGSKAPNPNQ